MSQPTFRPPRVGDPATARAMDGMDQALRGAVSGIASARQLKAVAVGTTDTPVAHGLGRPFTAWLVVRRTAAAQPFEGTQTDTSKFLVLQSSSAVTVDLLVW